MTAFTGILQRRLLGVLHRRDDDEIVIALHGPRSVGKSTLLSVYAESRGVTVVDFDNPALREAALKNPELAVSGRTPICIDEYQRAPAILDALKARLNREGGRPGTAVITGSTRHDALPRTSQALTGRLHVLTILPFSQGELHGGFENFLEQLFVDPDGTVAAHPTSDTSRGDYIQRAVTGGMPLAVARADANRNRWFDDYIKQSIERDSVELTRIRDRQLLRNVLDRVAGQTAQILNIAKLCDGLTAKRDTIENHVRLLEDLFLVQRLEAWGTTLRVRSQKRPKIHVVDSGVAGRLLRLTPAKLVGLNETALTELGNLLETFAVGELRKQISWMEEPVAIGHWRTFDGDEVDLVIERDDGSIVAFEVKANERVSGRELKGLRTLRDALGDRFVAGVALSTGTRSFTYEDRIHVCPLDRLWRTV